jgi:hypothetical protein
MGLQSRHTNAMAVSDALAYHILLRMEIHQKQGRGSEENCEYRKGKEEDKERLTKYYFEIYPPCRGNNPAGHVVLVD